MALTVPQNVEGTFGTGTQTITLTSSVAIGDVIVVSIREAPSANTYTATDSVNTGSYSSAGHYADATNNRRMSFLWMVANANGTPVITVVGTGGSSYQPLGYSIHGFAATPTLDTATYGANGTQYNATVAATTLTIGSLPTTSATNEVLFCQSIGGSGFISTFPGWTITPNGAQEAYAICTAAGTNKSGTITFGGSSTSDAMIIGIADVVTGVFTPQAGAGVLTGQAPANIQGAIVTPSTA